jgi:asparaginyl-tRNA synthetase
VVESKFAHLTYTEAIAILQKSAQNFEFPVEWGIDLQSEHERYLAETYCKKPLVLTDYPEKIKAFYMRLNSDGKTVAAMDVLVPKIGEIIGGAQREERSDVLEKKLRAFGLHPEDYWWYMQLRKYGTVPHAGFGLGFERLVLFTTGMENIRDVIPFPRFPGHAEF